MAHNATLTGVSSIPIVGIPSGVLPGLNDFQKLLYVDDLNDVFMNNTEFAIDIKIYHDSLSKWEDYKVIYDDPNATVNLSGDSVFNSIKPQFQIADSALAQRLTKKDRCTVQGINYYVENFISDGVGVTTVYLRLK